MATIVTAAAMARRPAIVATLQAAASAGLAAQGIADLPSLGMSYLVASALVATSLVRSARVMRSGWWLVPVSLGALAAVAAVVLGLRLTPPV
jgi:hypothetical protein